MTWKLRHQGSPRSIDGLNVADVLEGLQERLWEPTDEVMGPHDRQWVPIEEHAQFAGLAADLEPPVAVAHEDETRLDMNPLIDVSLVLLLFFILTTSYSALQKVLDMPDHVGKPTPLGWKDVNRVMVRVQARQVNSRPVYRVGDNVVEQAELATVLRRMVQETQKNWVLIDAEGVDWGTVVAIQDAAKGAGMQRASLLAKK